MAEKKFNVAVLTNQDGCFDLQFRKDVRRERTGSPTYYRWKAQFVVTGPKDNVKVLEKIKKELACGEVNISKDQARFSVQKIDDIAGIVVPFFKKNLLSDKKKKDFELWAKGVEVIHKNKGKHLAEWKKNDICTLIEIHKSSAKYKNKPREPKWLDMAKTLSKTN
ncbi:MAG: LAGLIDADG family homing endonuclease [Candidatus Staskawiczbacteria bacterium]|nr:LAGLIDADG family homing endonuclease [Candidatus Staskawiczbacteria bacterium]